MMPDLGRYSFYVLSAYGASIALLAAVVLLTWARSARVKRQLAEAEREARDG